VPLSAADLHATLTGCAPEASGVQGNARGADWRVLSDAAGDDIYLHRSGGGQPWQLVAVNHRPPPTAAPAWRAEYRDHQNGVPRTIRLTSVDAAGGHGGAFDLTLALSQVDINVPLEADVFHVQIPASADPITIDELRHARPGVRKN